MQSSKCTGKAILDQGSAAKHNTDSGTDLVVSDLSDAKEDYISEQ